MDQLEEPENLSLPLPPATTAITTMGAGGIKERGAVFTRREVVEFILDLCGYTSDRPLHEAKLLEPAFGHADFLVVAVERLLKAYFSRRRRKSILLEELSGAVRAIEVHQDSIRSAKQRLLASFADFPVKEEDASELLDSWIVEGDFLLLDMPITFSHVIGNPPYVRQELIPEDLLAEYRARYKTIYDRADIYVPFIERSLDLLSPSGVLGFICSDRWMKNKYGGPLRKVVARGHHLRYFVDMVDTPAFHQDVIAYPAITVIAKEAGRYTRTAHKPEISKESLSILARAMTAQSIPKGASVSEMSDVVSESEPWLLQANDKLAVVRRLEASFPSIEDAGCRIGIGVATGADSVFVGMYRDLPIEDERKLPLAMTKDIETGSVVWRGFGVVNPFEKNGKLVNLEEYPRLARYFETHKESILRRNCAKAHPLSWYRTIDRIHYELTGMPKLLIPDIKGNANIVYEKGELYPHHNLYYIVSGKWNLRALQTVLMSGIARLFVSTYSTTMRGGYLRFQAQYLRKIRLPFWRDVPVELQTILADIAVSGDQQAAAGAVADLYRLSKKEREAIRLGHSPE